MMKNFRRILGVGVLGVFGATVAVAAVIVTTVALPASTATAAVTKPFGVGIVFGEPTGLTIKYRMSPKSAVDGTLAYSLDKYVLINADYLHHFLGAFSGASEKFLRQLNPYLGIGGSLGLVGGKNSEIGLGARIPLGIEWVPDAHFGVFLEVAPGLWVVPATTGFVQGGLGARYHF